MSTEDSTLREVDQELAEERQMDIIRKVGPILAIGALALVVGVGVVQYLNSQKENVANAGAVAFHNAQFAFDDGETVGNDALDAIIEGDAKGYAALAAFQKAAILSRQGDVTQAYIHYQKIVSMEDITPNLQNLARIRSAYLSLDVGGRDAVLSDLGTLPQEETPLGYYARELVALAHLTAEDFDEAISGFENLSRSFATPPALKQRATEFAVLAKAGKAGANISGEARVEDLLESFGESNAASLEGGNNIAGNDAEIGIAEVPSFSDLADGLTDGLEDVRAINEKEVSDKDSSDNGAGTGHSDNGHNHEDDHEDDPDN